MGHTASKVKGSIPVGRGNAFGNLPVGSDGNILAADSSGPSGVNWSSSLLTVGAGVGISGFWIYGTGADGNVTLVGNTTLAAGDSVKNYNNLSLAGFDLTFDSTDFYGVVYVKDTLSGGGGDLVAENRGSGTTNAGGLGAVPPGGNGGDGAAAFYVFARNVTTVTEVTASGQGGVAAGGSIAGFSSGANSEYYANIVFKSKTYTQSPVVSNLGSQFGGGPGFGGAGIGVVIPAALRQEIDRTAKDWLRMVVMNGFSDYFAGAPPDERWSRSNGGGGGAAGFGPVGPGPGTFVSPGGGGGGGGAGIIGDGGNGSGASAISVTLDPAEFSTSGGGGGGGGGGGLVILVADTITAATFVSAGGGIGGAGGGGGGGTPPAPNGGGGGGGGGGYALAVVRSGVGFVSASAVGGAGGGGPGGTGLTGFPGLAVVLASA